MILLSGPAGFGKTSLICQWLGKTQLKVAWYSLDQEDNAADLFFRYLLSAFMQVDENFAAMFRQLLADQRELAGSNVIARIIASLTDADIGIWLVLDDFHHIKNTEILESFNRLIQYLPDCLHLVILSRHNLPSSMDAVLLKKERLEIGTSDLKFTEQETADLFREIIPIPFSADQISSINHHVEGWAAGLQLIGLSVRSKGRGTDLSYIMNRANKQVAGYLIHDILRLQSEKVRSFVFTTALLDRFNPDLCNHLIDYANASRMLARLARMNLFLIPLDEDRRWYRYHHMFSEVIRRQISIDTPELILSTLRKAATWFARNNYLEDALRSAFRSEDFEFAADLMEDHLPQYLEQRDPAAGIRWILKLPKRILKQRELLRLYHCGFSIILMEFADAKEILDELNRITSLVFERYSGHKRSLCEEYWTHFNCIMEIFHAEKTADVAQLQHLRHKFSSQNPSISSGIEIHLAFIFLSKGDLALAEQSLKRVSRLQAWPKYMWQKVYFAKAEALIARNRGELLQAETILKQALQSLAREGYDNNPMTFLLHRNLVYIFYLQNKLEKAWKSAAFAMQYNKHAGLLDEIKTGHELSLSLYLAAGDTEKAARRIREIKAYSVKLENSAVTASAEANAAGLAIEEGNLAVAERWAQQRNLRLDEPFSLLFAMECLTLVRLFNTRRQFTQAAHVLETLRKRCQKRGLRELMLQIDILRAAVFHALNQLETAKSLLQKALLFSVSEGYVRPFVNDAAMIAPILRRIADEPPATISMTHLEMIFTACNISLERPSGAKRFDNYEYENLTKREIQILGWMAQGLKNKEIAQKAYISTNTVKYHVRNILEKLNVKTRVKAILKAREMKII